MKTPPQPSYNSESELGMFRRKVLKDGAHWHIALVRLGMAH
jgi:hypothetical protein